MFPDDVDMRLIIATKMLCLCLKWRNLKLKIHWGNFEETIEMTFEGAQSGEIKEVKDWIQSFEYRSVLFSFNTLCLILIIVMDAFWGGFMEDKF